MTPRPALRRAFDATGPAALLAIPALVLVAAGQPLFTDDLWWHLALGRAYAEAGPWLEGDPLLFTATGPPSPAAWLADWGLAQLAGGAGFGALRVLHVACVLAVFAGLWRLARRAGASRATAAALVALFAVLAAYRLVQLRPHFATMLGALLVYRLLLEGRDPPTPTRMAIAALGMALWANLHGGFLLGPAMLFLAAGALGFGAWIAPDNADARAALLRRGAAIASTGALGLAATGLGPGGFTHHLALFNAGAETPALGIVLDEWAHLDPFRWPATSLPPSPLAWGIFWALLLATPWAAARIWRDLRRGSDPGSGAGRVPAVEAWPLLALAAFSLAASLYAVRFTWLCAFPLLLVARALPAWRPGPALRAAGVALALLLVGVFVRWGPWPMVSRGLAVDSVEAFTGAYAPAYAPGKYPAHATWLLSDMALEGRLFNEYVYGGFVGYWLAPQLRGFVNGTMNLPLPAMTALEAIREGRGVRPGEDLAALLDRYEVDLFLGVGVPALSRGDRPRWYSTALVEGLPGWIPVFRSQRSAVYLRDAPRNRENLARVADHYARAGVPFDPRSGFDAGRVLAEAPAWAVAAGVVPAAFPTLADLSRGGDGPARLAARHRLALAYGMVGLYEEALRLDERILRERPGDALARRGRVWSLLHLGRFAEASQAARALADGDLERLLHSVAAALDRDPADPLALSVIRRLPLLTPEEAAALLLPTQPPALRPPR